MTAPAAPQPILLSLGPPPLFQHSTDDDTSPTCLATAGANWRAVGTSSVPTSDERGGTGRRDRPQDGSKTAGDNEASPPARARSKDGEGHRPTATGPAAGRHGLGRRRRTGDRGGTGRRDRPGDEQRDGRRQRRLASSSGAVLKSERDNDRRQRDRRSGTTTDYNGTGGGTTRTRTAAPPKLSVRV